MRTNMKLSAFVLFVAFIVGVFARTGVSNADQNVNDGLVFNDKARKSARELTRTMTRQGRKLHSHVCDCYTYYGATNYNYAAGACAGFCNNKQGIDYCYSNGNGKLVDYKRNAVPHIISIPAPGSNTGTYQVSCGYRCGTKSGYNTWNGEASCGERPHNCYANGVKSPSPYNANQICKSTFVYNDKNGSGRFTFKTLCVTEDKAVALVGDGSGDYRWGPC